MANKIPVSLIPSEVLSILTSIMNWASFLGGTLYIWNRPKRRISLTTSSAKISQFVFFTFVWASYLIYLAWAVVHGLFLHKPVYYYLICLVTILGGSLPMLGLILCFVKLKEISAWTNSVLKFDEWVSGKCL